MPQNDCKRLALDLADTLSSTDDLRSELVSIGMLTTGLISEAPEDQRAELVDTFCSLLRPGVAQQLN